MKVKSTARGTVTIIIDTPPGFPRPGHVLPGIIAGLGLDIDPASPKSMHNGRWLWQVTIDNPDPMIVKLSKRISELKRTGVIRFGDVF